jgi:NADH-quinone oxidoreductase subunit K
MSPNDYLYLSAVLFSLGFLGALTRRDTLVVLMNIELMLIASTVALAAFSRFYNSPHGALLVLFILAIAAAEVAIGLAIITRLRKLRNTTDITRLTSLKN